MRCPWAIQTIMLYCAGTDQSCKLDEVNHFHLFRVSNNVISFNVKQGQHYELFVPADKDSQGLWHNEGIVPYEQAPDFRDRIDPLAPNRISYPWRIHRCFQCDHCIPKKTGRR